MHELGQRIRRADIWECHCLLILHDCVVLSGCWCVCNLWCYNWGCRQRWWRRTAQKPQDVSNADAHSLKCGIRAPLHLILYQDSRHSSDGEHPVTQHRAMFFLTFLFRDR